MLRNGSLAAAFLLLVACASGNRQESREVSLSDTCAPGETLICEVPNTGRITHGSFSKGRKKCACEYAREGAPIIPGVP
jgi:hypothetical protein